MATATKTGLAVRSTAFSHNGHIPKKYSCEGDNVNPPLEVSDSPEETKTLAVIVDDPDAPRGVTTHWLVWNISPNEPIAENHIPGVSGKNSHGKTGYMGPCPPSGSHRYFFHVYALDTTLDLPVGADRQALQQAMEGHILARGELMAHYKRSGASL